MSVAQSAAQSAQFMPRPLTVAADAAVQALWLRGQQGWQQRRQGRHCCQAQQVRGYPCRTVSRRAARMPACLPALCPISGCRRGAEVHKGVENRLWHRIWTSEERGRIKRVSSQIPQQTQRDWRLGAARRPRRRRPVGQPGPPPQCAIVSAGFASRLGPSADPFGAAEVNASHSGPCASLLGEVSPALVLCSRHTGAVQQPSRATCALALCWGRGGHVRAACVRVRPQPLRTPDAAELPAGCGAVAAGPSPTAAAAAAACPPPLAPLAAASLERVRRHRRRHGPARLPGADLDAVGGRHRCLPRLCSRLHLRTAATPAGEH